ncbi:DeoR family transcriptional regulator [Klebsiella variicola subsp. variicola]|nr:DeoR family transcriptional regulator [Klebsiella variicola subsp. variicola]
MAEQFAVSPQTIRRDLE